MNEHKAIFKDLHQRQDALMEDIILFKDEMLAFEVSDRYPYDYIVVFCICTKNKY